MIGGPLMEGDQLWSEGKVVIKNTSEKSKSQVAVVLRSLALLHTATEIVG
jgi:hypothetical protein